MKHLPSNIARAIGYLCFVLCGFSLAVGVNAVWLVPHVLIGHWAVTFAVVLSEREVSK